MNASTDDAPEVVLRTPRLVFRHWTPGDAALAQALWGDPAVTQLVGGPFAAPVVAARLAHEIARQEAHGVSYWPMFLRADGAFAGCCGLRPCDSDDADLELGFHLRPRCWGLGLADEAARGVIAHAFGTLGVRALFAGHHRDNEASARRLRALGFRRTLDAFYAPTGRMHPSYLLAADAWRRARGDAPEGTDSPASA